MTTAHQPAEWPGPAIEHIVRRIKDTGTRARLRRNLRTSDPGTDIDTLAVIGPFVRTDGANDATSLAGIAGLMAYTGASGPGTKYRSLPTVIAASDLSDDRKDRLIQQLLRPGTTPASQIRLIQRAAAVLKASDIDWSRLRWDLVNLSDPQRRDRTVRSWMRDYTTTTTTTTSIPDTESD